MSSFRLTPAQNSTFVTLKDELKTGNLLFLASQPGRGRTTILQRLREETGGAFLSATEFIESSGTRHPLSLEEALYATLTGALDKHDTVYVDDIHLLLNVCHHPQYARTQYVETVILALTDIADLKGKKLILSGSGAGSSVFASRYYTALIGRFLSGDYACLIENLVGPEIASQLNHTKIFNFSPKLTAHQLTTACRRLLAQGPFDTERFVEYLRSQQLGSNVDLFEVQAVDLADLQGVDDVLRSLEIHIVLPLETDPLKNDLALRPKRGVLLYGPPGTGKTTIGRALAHRLRGRFFLIDRTFIAGTGDFYGRVHHIFQAAKENSPAVIFIDDADAIFEGGEEQGLYRYLLTMLDGLESEGSARVCVMMTAMNLGHLPPALVRSGRVELWLEMKMPDAGARARILEQHIAKLPAELKEFDREKIIELTDGFTGADLKRLVDDAKGLYAFDRAQGRNKPSTTEYFTEAAAAVRENNARYEAAEQASQARPRQSSTTSPSIVFRRRHIEPE